MSSGKRQGFCRDKCLFPRRAHWHKMRNSLKCIRTPKMHESVELHNCITYLIVTYVVLYIHPVELFCSHMCVCVCMCASDEYNKHTYAMSCTKLHKFTCLLFSCSMHRPCVCVCVSVRCLLSVVFKRKLHFHVCTQYMADMKVFKWHFQINFVDLSYGSLSQSSCNKCGV